jgi:hypothetical protein
MSPKRKEPASATRRTVSPWVKGFVVFHIIAISIWAMPSPPEAYMKGTVKWKLRPENPRLFTQSLNDGLRVFNENQLKPSLVKYYLLPSGFWQYWDMFAPNPADTDWYGDALVIYKDGTERTYTFPRMEKMDILSKYMMERFRKFYERAHDENYQFLWPAFGQRVALLSTSDPNNPPVEVRLTRHWRTVEPPGKPQPVDYNSYEYYRYSVDQEMLQHDLKVWY